MLKMFMNHRIVHRKEKIYHLDLEQIVEHFLNPLTRNEDLQDIRIR